MRRWHVILLRLLGTAVGGKSREQQLSLLRAPAHNLKLGKDPEIMEVRGQEVAGTANDRKNCGLGSRELDIRVGAPWQGP